MSSAIEDTQPRSPFKDQARDKPLITPPDEGFEPPRGPGCLIWTVIGVVSLGAALVIVLLAATAGWTAGQRIAQVTSTAVIAATADSQLTRIPLDAQSGNLYMVARRIEYLETLLPNMPVLPQLAQTATALYLTSLPTSTLPPTQTPTAAPTIQATTAPVIPTSAPNSSGYNLDELLQQARDYMSLSQWADAIAILDVILGIDPAYQPAAVKGLMLEALRLEAKRLYNENKLAEAILLTNRAEEFGLSAQDELRYERYAASLYLDAIRTIGTDYVAAIRALRAVYDLGPGRYYDEVRKKLFDQYVAYADAWTFQNEHCPAYTQYQNALAILSSPQVTAKRDSANTLCLQATPTLGPGQTPGAEGQPIAPVGVIESPTPGA